MSIREELDALRSRHAGVDHLVYADMAASMVLLASSSEERPQEAHDRLAARGIAALGGPFGGLDTAAGADPVKVMVKQGHTGPELFVSGGAESLFFVLNAGADVSGLAAEASDLLAKFAEEDD